MMTMPLRKSTPEFDRELENIVGGLDRLKTLSRRNFLKAGAMSATGLLLSSFAGLLATTSKASGENAADAGQTEKPDATGTFVFPRLQFSTTDGTPKHWNISPDGDVILRRELKKRTNTNISMEPKVVRLGEFDDMVRNPFVFMTAGGSFALPADEEKNLCEFLERGGFIFADDCMGIGPGGGDAFFRCYQNLIAKFYPNNPMRKIPYDHEIFHIFFDFADGCPFMQGVNHGAYGLFEPGTGRIMTWLSPGDLHCGWCCRFWSMEKNLAAIKMGINVVYYYLTH